MSTNNNTETEIWPAGPDSSHKKKIQPCTWLILNVDLWVACRGKLPNYVKIYISYKTDGRYRHIIAQRLKSGPQDHTQGTKNNSTMYLSYSECRSKSCLTGNAPKLRENIYFISNVCRCRRIITQRLKSGPQDQTQDTKKTILGYLTYPECRSVSCLSGKAPKLRENIYFI